MILLRHGKSSWSDPTLADLDRPLAPRGKRASRRIAKYMRRKRIRPALVLCSTSLRTRQTLEAIEPSLDRGCFVELVPELYAASERELLERLQAVRQIRAGRKQRRLREARSRGPQEETDLAVCDQTHRRLGSPRGCQRRRGRARASPAQTANDPTGRTPGRSLLQPPRTARRSLPPARRTTDRPPLTRTRSGRLLRPGSSSLCSSRSVSMSQNGGNATRVSRV